jgi:hypothetical protein
LVTVLTITMIGAVLTITALLVIRLNTARQVVLVTPEAYALPQGVALVGYSVVDGRAVLIGDDGVIRVFDSDTGELQTEIGLDGE